VSARRRPCFEKKSVDAWALQGMTDENFKKSGKKRITPVDNAMTAV
jgi:hypothetical protein